MIPTEPIGSLPRPLALIEAAVQGESDDPRLDPLYDAAIRDTIERFEATGSPVVTDGEQRKYHNFWTYCVHGLPNTAPDGFKIPFSAGHTRRMPRLTAGPFRYKRYADSYLDVARRYATVALKQAVISPSALSLMYPAEGLAGYSREQFIDDLLAEHEKEIRRCFQKGAYRVQIDFTEGRLAMKIDPSGHLLHSFIDLNNLALSRFSNEDRLRIGVHTCPGGDLDSTHSADVDYAALLPSLFELKVGNFYIALAGETDRAQVLKTIRQYMKPDHRVFVGVVAPIDPRVESAEEVRDRVLQAAQYIPLEQLGTTDDCGFSPFSDDTSTSRDTAFAKIRARVAGTALAAEALGGNVVAALDDEERLLRSVALQNANTILLARQRAEAELLRTREALRISQEQLMAALAAAGTGTFRWHIKTNSVEWNGNLDQLFGLAPGRTTQSLEAFFAAVHPDDRSAVRARCDQCARDGSDLDMEFRVIAPDGGVRWIAGRAKASFDDAATPVSMTGAFVDFTIRKQAAETLRENEERLRAIFNQAAVGIAVTTLDGTFLDSNQRFTDILGYDADELRHRTFFDITHPDDLADTTIAVRQLLAGFIPDYSLEKRYLRKDGSQVWSLSTVTLLKDVAGQPERFIGVIEDISSRKHAETALRDETRILELLNETGRILASKLDLNAAAQAVTDAATQLSGAQFGAFFYNTPDEAGDAFSLRTLSGAPRAAFEKAGPSRITALFGPAFRGQASFRCDDVLLAAGDEITAFRYGMPDDIPVRSCLAVPVSSRSGEVIGGLFFGHAQPAVFNDRIARLIIGVAAQAGIAIDNARLYEAAQNAADERKSLLERERVARAAAERMSDMKDEFLATLSHELRTPLNAILGWSQVLRTGSREAADYLKGLETIERNARVQTQLIDDLLDMSRITSGKLRLNIQLLQPASFIEAAMETVRPAADANGIRLEKLLDPAAGPISGDPGRLQQVIWNLLSNAIKFTPKNGKIQVLLERANSHIEISIADTGIGIKPEFIPHLFERFRQGDASTTRKYGGLGLGLSIVKNLVELHGGIVLVKSPGAGRGTTVSVHLPLTAVHQIVDSTSRLHPSTSSASTSAFIPAELAGLKVLVVDDQSDARDLIKRVLEDCAADVITAGTAADALLLIEVHKPDVLISDIGMPDVDGFELLRRVRALGPDRGGSVQAIALTAFARSEDRTRVLRAGFQVHVSKPVDPSELVATVASVAGRTLDGGDPP